MKKTCSIRLLLGIVLLTTALGISTGFFAGTRKNWSNYERRIALLEDEIQKQTEEIQEKEAKESLKVVEPYEYILMEEQGYVVVYLTDKKTIYAVTDICIAELPEELQMEIADGKYIGSEEQLYNFLENYSS